MGFEIYCFYVTASALTINVPLVPLGGLSATFAEAGAKMKKMAKSGRFQHKKSHAFSAWLFYKILVI